jgi:ABC-type phosphate/phosphonate transport system substrate-binding protein
MNILRMLVAPLAEGGRFFSDVRVSGAHERSLELLGSGEVDVACVDCVTYELLASLRPASLEGVRIIEETPLAPAPPFVTSSDATPGEVAILREALVEVLDLDEIARPLLLAGVEVLSASAYESMITMRDQAQSLLSGGEFEEARPV